MNLQRTLYTILSANSELVGQLAKSEINPEAPAIYDSWAEEWGEFPFLVITFACEYVLTNKTRASIDIDLFCKHDQQRAHDIMQLIIDELHNKKLFDDTGAYYRFYYENDSEVLLDTDELTQWNGAFTAICWENKQPRR